MDKNTQSIFAYFAAFSAVTALSSQIKNKTTKKTQTQQINYTHCTDLSFFLPLPSVQFLSAGNKRKSQQRLTTLFPGSWSSQETKV